MKKNSIILASLFLILFSSQILVSQNTETKNNKILLGINITPQLSNWYLKTTPENSWFTQFHDSTFKHKNGLSFGIDIEIPIKNKISLKTALLASFKRYETPLMEVNISDPILTYEYISTAGSDYFLDIPILIKYDYFSSKKIKLSIGGGIVNKFRILDHHKMYGSHSSNSDNKILLSKNSEFVNYFDYWLALKVEASLRYSITPRLSTGISTSYEHAITHNFKQSEINLFYYLFAVGMNISFQI
jgi:hypothetical protein